MPIYNREDSYIKILTERTHTVKELADKLFLSEPTVRRDIVQLKRKNILSCTNGKVSLNVMAPDKRIPMLIRDYENVEAKQQMAQKAVSYIHDGDVIMLDASTSAYSLLPYLPKFKDLFIITSGAKTSLTLSSMGIKHICTGGEAIPESFSFIGPDAEKTLKNYNADISFFSCRGLNQQGFASDNSMHENQIRKTIIEQSKRNILLCDSSKLGKTYLHNFCNISNLSDIICETSIPNNFFKH